MLAVIACITMLGAALAALAQDDIKRVLAYSTVSQLAYMLAALAVGSALAAIFHLLTHAAFKALLFLAAGSVIHAVGTNLMPDMGGLRKAMPVTFATMTVGLAALAGMPPFAGFFSKEAVLGAAEETARHGGPVRVLGRLAGAASSACVTVALTAAYATRLWLLTFFGAAAQRRRRPTSRRRRCAGRWSCSPSPPRCSVLVGLPLGLAADAGWSTGRDAVGRRRCTSAWSRPCCPSLLAAVGVRRGARWSGGARRRPTRRGVSAGCGRRSCTRSTSTTSTTGCSSGRSGVAARAVRWTDDEVVVGDGARLRHAARRRLAGLLRADPAAATCRPTSPACWPASCSSPSGW